jgi:hypothetical protein
MVLPLSRCLYSAKRSLLMRCNEIVDVHQK